MPVDCSLPEGMTCDDCKSRKRCFGIGYSKLGREECDFYPIRFKEDPFAKLKKMQVMEMEYIAYDGEPGIRLTSEQIVKAYNDLLKKAKGGE